MNFIPFKTYTGIENMQIDSDLLENAIVTNQQEPTLRLYGWNPKCVSLGRNQLDNFLDYEFLKKNNIDVVKRITGGRALLHDMEITYSYVCPVSSLTSGESVGKSYIEISNILIKFFEKLGIKLEFGSNREIHTKFDYCMLISTGADLCYKGKKLIGSAQCRKNGYILQHGSIPYDYDINLLEQIFHEKPDINSFTSLSRVNPDIFFMLQSLSEF